MPLVPPAAAALLLLVWELAVVWGLWLVWGLSPAGLPRPVLLVLPGAGVQVALASLLLPVLAQLLPVLLPQEARSACALVLLAMLVLVLVATIAWALALLLALWVPLLRVPRVLQQMRPMPWQLPWLQQLQPQ